LFQPGRKSHGKKEAEGKCEAVCDNGRSGRLLWVPLGSSAWGGIGHLHPAGLGTGRAEVAVLGRQ